MSFAYTLVRSKRKSIGLEIKPDGTLWVRAPQRMRKADIEAFILSHENWIHTHQDKVLSQKENHPSLPDFTEQERISLMNEAKTILSKRVAYYAGMMQITYGRITIRSQKTRWGSCSSKGNLNFNCLLMLAPPEVLDYVVVHELCHRIEMNHSRRFWALVENVLPDYKEQKRWLKEHGNSLISRLPE